MRTDSAAGGAALTIQTAVRAWCARNFAHRRLARRGRQAFALSWRHWSRCANLLRSSRLLHAIRISLHGGVEGGKAVRRRYSARFSSSTSFFARLRGLAPQRSEHKDALAQPLRAVTPAAEFEAASRQRAAATVLCRAIRHGCVGRRAAARAALGAWVAFSSSRRAPYGRGVADSPPVRNALSDSAPVAALDSPRRRGRALRGSCALWRGRAAELGAARAATRATLLEADRIQWLRWVREALLLRAAVRLQAAERARAARRRHSQRRRRREDAAAALQCAARRRLRARSVAADVLLAAYTRGLTRALLRRLRALRVAERAAAGAFAAYETAVAFAGLDGGGAAAAAVAEAAAMAAGVPAAEVAAQLALLRASGAEPAAFAGSASAFDREEDLSEMAEYARFSSAHERYRACAEACEQAASRLARRLFLARQAPPALPLGGVRAAAGPASARSLQRGESTGAARAEAMPAAAPEGSTAGAAGAERAAGSEQLSRAAQVLPAPAALGASVVAMTATLRRFFFGTASHVPFQPPRAPRRPIRAVSVPRSRAAAPSHKRLRSRTPNVASRRSGGTAVGAVGGARPDDTAQHAAAGTLAGACGTAGARGAGGSHASLSSAADRQRTALKSRPGVLATNAVGRTAAAQAPRPGATRPPRPPEPSAQRAAMV